MECRTTASAQSAIEATAATAAAEAAPRCPAAPRREAAQQGVRAGPLVAPLAAGGPTHYSLNPRLTRPPRLSQRHIPRRSVTESTLKCAGRSAPCDPCVSAPRDP
ncbi:unnamed protein product [Lampetra planeri]